MSDTISPATLRAAIEAAKATYQSTGDTASAERVAWRIVDLARDYSRALSA